MNRGIACSIALAAAALMLVGRAEPMLIFNGSPSVPRGFYLRSNASLRAGAFVTVRAAAVAPDYARQRDFADPSDRFIKRIAAVGGDTVCAHDDTVTIGATLRLSRLRTDNRGRTLPTWSGCVVLSQEQLFLVGDTNDSFDSRYWGPAKIGDIDGVWTPIRSVLSTGSAPH